MDDILGFCYLADSDVSLRQKPTEASRSLLYVYHMISCTSTGLENTIRLNFRFMYIYSVVDDRSWIYVAGILHITYFAILLLNSTP